ncbi:MAG: hypothetical protein GX491_00715 [Chloroflexi bacterium]|nr:hypothetical protein [Chloroflexota bacterium]
MASYVKFQLDDGTEIFFETTETPRGSSSLIPSASSKETAHEGGSFQESIESLRKMASVMVRELRDRFEKEPDEMQFNFGLKASGELGSLIVSRGGQDANFNVMLRWRSDKADQQNAAEDGKTGKKAAQEE